jgi:hypothetical protein
MNLFLKREILLRLKKFLILPKPLTNYANDSISYIFEGIILSSYKFVISL